jgi:hypothetical protein
MIGSRTEIARLETALAADTPELKTEQEKWEKAVGAGAAWLPLDFSSMKSQSGASLTKQPDDSIVVSGIDPMTDTYTLVGNTPIRNISAIRLEAIPDSRLPAGGPGRAPNGNFVLSSFTVFASPKDALRMNPPIEFKSAQASFEQQNYPPANALIDRKDAGWAILPNVGKPSIATFYPNEPFGADGGSTLTVILGHEFSMGHHNLGRFRISVTSNTDPDSAAAIPREMLAILKVPADKRDAKQKAELAEYFRSIAPSLEPIRRELAERKADVEREISAARGKKFVVPFMVNRAGFTGDVRVTLEGFVTARNPESGAPVPLNNALKVEPITLNATKPGGEIDATVEGGAGTGPRYCILRAEGKAGDDDVVVYSEPFVLTVLQK